MVKLSIGTVQFGLDYGMANTAGQVSLYNANAILHVAYDNDIQALDTAIAYGTSEQVLGKIGVADFQVVTKLPAIPEGSPKQSWAEKQLAESLHRLQLSKVYGALLHQPLQLLEQNGSKIYDSMQKAKKDGLVEKIGISVYEPGDLEKLCNQYDFDLIQVPMNIIDNRWDDWLSELHSRKVEIHVRSVFLQGLLLMSQQARPNKFDKWADLWNKWENWLKEHNLTPLEACLRYVLSKPEIAKVIVGVDSKEQLQQIIEAVNGDLPEFPSDIKINDVQLLNPSNWSVL